MLTINGRKFAKNQAEFVSTLFHPDGTATGLYKIRRGRGRVAIELRGMLGEPRALIAPDGAIVTATLSDGKPFYMFSTTRETEEWIGLSGMTMRQLREIGTNAIREVSTCQA